MSICNSSRHPLRGGPFTSIYHCPVWPTLPYTLFDVHHKLRTGDVQCSAPHHHMLCMLLRVVMDVLEAAHSYARSATTRAEGGRTTYLLKLILVVHQKLDGLLAGSP